jgi:UDP-glucose:(heptosyl)LPS alpha-1,3-glucosyltransferase
MDRNRYQTHIRAGNGVHAAYLESRVLTEGWRKKITCKINPLHRKILSLEKTAFENPGLQKLFTNSFLVRDQVLKYYATDPSKIQVIHNGVEWYEMQSDFDQWEQARGAIFQKFHLDPNCFHFLFIGNGYLRKGLNQLLIGLSQLTNRDFHLSVIGKDNRLEEYRAKAEKLGLKNHVRFFGPSQETRLFYQMADALIIPSFYDPFANVTVEALAMGLYVASSKNNGGCEILTAHNGTLIEDLLDPAAMVEALKNALCHRKTRKSAIMIRESVQYLDFANQLKILMGACE